MYLNKKELLNTIKNWKDLDNMQMAVLGNRPTQLIEKLNEDTAFNKKKSSKTRNIILSEENLNNIIKIVDTAHCDLIDNIRDLVSRVETEIMDNIEKLNVLPESYAIESDKYLNSSVEMAIIDVVKTITTCNTEYVLNNIYYQLFAISSNLKIINMNEQELYEELLRYNMIGIEDGDNGYCEFSFSILEFIAELDTNSFEIIADTNAWDNHTDCTVSYNNHIYNENIDICLNILSEKYGY